MKRVIEIDEDRYDVLQKLEKATHGTGYMNYFEETIANSTPLNEVLDEITDEVKKVDPPRCRTYDAYFEGRREAVERVLDIIAKYKESEGEK